MKPGSRGQGPEARVPRPGSRGQGPEARVPRPGSPGQSLTPKVPSQSLQARAFKPGPSGQGFQARASMTGPSGQGHQAKDPRPTDTLRERMERRTDGQTDKTSSAFYWTSSLWGHCPAYNLKIENLKRKKQGKASADHILTLDEWQPTFLGSGPSKTMSYRDILYVHMSLRSYVCQYDRLKD